MSFYAGHLAGTLIAPYFTEIKTIVESHQDIKRTVKGIAYQAFCAIVGTIIGGLLGGPLGALAGSVIGGVYGYNTVMNYKSVAGIMHTMSEEEKERLVIEVQSLVGENGCDALKNFVRATMNRDALIQMVLSRVSGPSRRC